MLNQQTATLTAAEVDGRHGFGFVLGEWVIANRKLEDPLAEEPTQWLEFEAASGIGGFDMYYVEDMD